MNKQVDRKLVIFKLLTDGLKTCRKCLVDKGPSEFSINSRSMDGLCIYCKECQKIYNDTKYGKDNSNTKDYIKEQTKYRDPHGKWVFGRFRVCKICKQAKSPDDFYKSNRSWCKDCTDNRILERKNRLREIGLCISCGKYPAEPIGTDECTKCKTTRNESKVLTKESYKLKFIEMYGGSCECCGETEPHFLTADHINRDGHRDSRRQYYKYIKNKRDDIRLLCWNCNCGRELNGGVCPHEKRNEVPSF